mgnify:CR=1 FL=1
MFQSKILRFQSKYGLKLIEGQGAGASSPRTTKKGPIEKKSMQILEKCMEDMKAVYRLNEEKLEFNYKVLKEREKVNTNTI